MLVGTGKTGELKENDWVLLGGTAGAAISARKTKTASLIAEAADNGGTKPEAIAALLAFGAALRNYEFRKYLTKRPSEDEGNPSRDAAEARHPCRRPRQGARRVRPLPGRSPTASSLARDLVNEPANALGPVEFAERVQASWRSSGSRSRSSTPTSSAS